MTFLAMLKIASHKTNGSKQKIHNKLFIRKLVNVYDKKIQDNLLYDTKIRIDLMIACYLMIYLIKIRRYASKHFAVVNVCSLMYNSEVTSVNWRYLK